MFFHAYLDDWLLRHSDRQLLLQQRDPLLLKAKDLGFLVNFSKSRLVPAQEFVYIGVGFRTMLGLVHPPPDRIQAISAATGALMGVSLAKARTLLSWLGLVNSAADNVAWGRLYMRPMQMFLLSVWRMKTESLDKSLVLPHELLNPVWTFWRDSEHLSRGVPSERPSPTTVLTTDASEKGWGVT
jgi:hypothetical protein